MKHISSFFRYSELAIVLLMTTFLTSCTDKSKAEGTAVPASDAQEQVEKAASAESAETAQVSATEQDSDTVAAEPSSEEPQKKSALTPVHMGMWGNVGGTGFLFDMDGTKGSYIPYDMAEAKEYGERRQLELVSYNPKSGKCVINAFLRGAYIGQFDGNFQEEEVEMEEGESHYYQMYEGIFKSVKGAKLNFHFHYD